MIVKKYGALTELERWGSAAPVDGPADLVHEIHQDSTPRFDAAIDAFTLVVDLKQSSETIFAGFTKDTRTEVRRAEKTDALTHRVHLQDDTRLDQFLDDYHAFAREKQPPTLADPILRGYWSQATLVITSIGRSDGPVLSWHSYIKGGRSVILLQSFSTPAAGNVSGAERGRANRLHHWRDMVLFKQAGFEEYDFGGWYPYLDSPELLNINRFKEEFGGGLVRKVNVRRALTTRGRLALLLLSVRGRFTHEHRELAMRAKALKQPGGPAGSPGPPSTRT